MGMNESWLLHNKHHDQWAKFQCFPNENNITLLARQHLKNIPLFSPSTSASGNPKIAPVIDKTRRQIVEISRFIVADAMLTSEYELVAFWSNVYTVDGTGKITVQLSAYVTAEYY